MSTQHHEHKKENKALNRQERYKLRQLEFKEENQRTICIVNLVSTVITIGLAVATLVILNVDKTSCDASKLRLTLWLMLGMHVINTVEAVCGLTGLDNIFCGCICVVGFFVYEIAVLVYMQTVFYNSKPCEHKTPTQYWWLLANIIIYFGFLGISCFFHLKAYFGKPKEDEDEKDNVPVLGMAIHREN